MKKLLIAWMVAGFGFLGGAALAQDEVSLDEVLRVLKEARDIATQRVIKGGGKPGVVPISFSELAERFQESSNLFPRVAYSDRFLTTYISMHRTPGPAKAIVPLISFPEDILDRVWLDAFTKLPEGQGIVSIETVADMADLSLALTEAVIRSSDFENRKTAARAEGRVFALVFPVTERQLTQAIRKVAVFARMSEEEVREHRDFDPRVEENLRTLLKAKTLETDLERFERQRVHVVTRAALRASQTTDALVRAFDETSEAFRAAQGERLVSFEERSRGGMSRGPRFKSFVERVVARVRGVR